MDPIVKQLFNLGDKMQLDRPEELDKLRKFIGPRKQNGSVQIYAYIDLSSTVDLLYLLQQAARNKDYDLKTVIRVAVDWLRFIGERAPSCFNLEETSSLTAKVIDVLKQASTSEQVVEILRATEYYYSQLRYWVDLDFPWHEVGVAYAAAKGDPAPVA
jgi:hypothetical protein